MLIVAVVVSSVLAAAIAYSAVRKLTRTPAVVAQYGRAGVRESWLVPLAILLLLAAAGLVAGIFWEPLALLTGCALAVYFTVAVIFHLRHRDARSTLLPIALGLLAIASVALRMVARHQDEIIRASH